MNNWFLFGPPILVTWLGAHKANNDIDRECAPYALHGPILSLATMPEIDE